MNLSNRKLVRIASRIRDQLLTLKQSKQRQVQSTATGLIEPMNRLTRIRRKLNLCEICNWQAAGEKVLRQVEAALRDVPYHGQQVEQAIQVCNIKVPSVAEIFRELIQADEEFDGLVHHTEGDRTGRDDRVDRAERCPSRRVRDSASRAEPRGDAIQQHLPHLCDGPAPSRQQRLRDSPSRKKRGHKIKIKKGDILLFWVFVAIYGWIR